MKDIGAHLGYIVLWGRVRRCERPGCMCATLTGGTAKSRDDIAPRDSCGAGPMCVCGRPLL
jgi:hypothetical protein